MMSWLATFVLSVLHALYKLVLAFKSLSARFLQEPLPLASERSKVPSHLALNLISNPEADEEDNEKYMLNSVENVAAWCQAVGIKRLTVYDRDGDFILYILEFIQVKVGLCGFRNPCKLLPGYPATCTTLSPRTGPGRFRSRM